MTTRIALLAFLLQLAAFAQAPVEEAAPPPEVDQALRARANGFFQDLVEGNFRKADEFVAEDTKDAYFNAGHSRLNSFTIQSLKYSDKFTKAVVTVLTKRNLNILGEDIELPVPSVTSWKIENGKWVWYQEPTPPGPVGIIGPAVALPGNPPPVPGSANPTNDADLKAAVAMAFKQPGLGQSSLDKSEVTLAADQVSEAKVVFQNGMPGMLQLRLSMMPNQPGFSATLENAQVNIGGKAELILRYDPAGVKEPPSPVTVQLTTFPTNQVFKVDVKFTGPGAR